MIITNFECTNFRNLVPIKLEPGAEMNVIFGENGQGKTNLLEGIWLFCGAKSFRGSKDSELVAFGSSKASLSCSFIKSEVEREAKIIIEEKRKAELAGKSLPSATGLAGAFFSVVFSPQDLGLVNDGPAVRRRFLDTAIGQIYPLYIEKLKEYNRAVTQRNAILRDIRFHPDLAALLDDFEKSVAVSAAELLKYRYRYIEIISQTAPPIYAGISNNREEFSLEYLSKIPREMKPDEILSLLKQCRKEDMESGGTSIGPHRDDVAFLLNGISARNFGSQGQRRSVSLSLKLAEAEILKKITGEYPIALLDDVMSELDPTRQDFILNHIGGWQVFLTCCDPSNIKGLQRGSIYSMEKGILTRRV